MWLFCILDALPWNEWVKPHQRLVPSFKASNNSICVSLRKRIFAGVGATPPPKKDMHRFVKWPKYVRVQRQRRVLNQRLKVPPALNRFTKTLDKNAAFTVFKLLLKYRPEDKTAKKVNRLSHYPLISFDIPYFCRLKILFFTELWPRKFAAPLELCS